MLAQIPPFMIYLTGALVMLLMRHRQRNTDTCTFVHLSDMQQCPLIAYDVAARST